MDLQVKNIKINKAIKLCKELFNTFDELWLVGHKGDHHQTLVNLGILPPYPLTLVHVHSSLGVKAKHIIPPPEGSGISVESVSLELNPIVSKYLDKSIKEQKKVCILTPFPNEKLDRMITHKKASKSIFTTSSTKTCEDFFTIGNKLRVNQIVSNALRENKQTKKYIDTLLIPSINYAETNGSFADIQKKLHLKSGEGVYFQIDISASGEGTKRVSSQEELQTLLQDDVWSFYQHEKRLRVSKEIKHAYSANGSACIVPISSKECFVLLDPLSHKPTGLSELRAKENSGVGNDWSTPWSSSIQKQYMESTIAIGMSLYKHFGYTGIFGPDFIVERKGNKEVLKITEINARWQGTTPYQTMNAILAQRIPLELIHYIIKLDLEHTYIKKLLHLIGDPYIYNLKSINANGCFYIKVGNPQGKKTIKRDMNGTYIVVDGILRKYSKSTMQFRKNASFVTVKAPRKNEVVGGASFTPIGYIYGVSNTPVFLPDIPEITPFGKNLYVTITDELFKD